MKVRILNFLKINITSKSQEFKNIQSRFSKNYQLDIILQTETCSENEMLKKNMQCIWGAKENGMSDRKDSKITAAQQCNWFEENNKKLKLNLKNYS